MLKPQDVTSHFYAKIPISQQLGIQVLEVSPTHAKIHVPLAPNINHVQTAFGGSLYAAAALSCYALFQAMAHAAGGFSDELVIQQGKIQYLAPITTDFLIRAEMKDVNAGQNFIEALRRQGKARIDLRANIFEAGKYEAGSIAAIFEGTYVYRGPRTSSRPEEGKSI